MSRRGDTGVLLASGVVVLLALAALVWMFGLTPSFGTATVGAAPTRGGGPWIARLGVSQLEPWSSPNPAFAERLAMLGDAQGAILEQAVCRGGDMDADPAFREARRALARNDRSLCAAPLAHVAAVSPVIVTLGPGLGWPTLIVGGFMAAGLAVWRALALKRAYDYWRLLGRSTFGTARRAGSG